MSLWELIVRAHGKNGSRCGTAENLGWQASGVYRLTVYRQFIQQLVSCRCNVWTLSNEDELEHSNY